MKIILALLVAAIIVYAVVRLRAAPSAVEKDADAQVIAQLKVAGSDTSRPHEVDFFFYFESEAAAEEVVRALRERGFPAEHGPSAGDPGTWVVEARKSLVPTQAAMSGLTQEFRLLASRNGGTYDGWGAGVVR